MSPVYVGRGDAGPGRVVHQRPVIVGGKLREALQAVQYGMAAFPAAGRPDDTGMAGQRQGRPALVFIRHHHGNALHPRVFAERQQAVFDHGAVQQPEVLFGFVRAHAPAAAAGRDNGPEVRLPRHGAATGSARGVSGSRSWWTLTGASIIW